ncbi:hypothetical protein [Nocardioides soli]|uniref:Uncharacterized protein n=1 Tax=Nocardioides soli TaxID=1036020 RepID=A0A7W4VZD0_9ACTN|nr:hypothetical protein [Nocardioides soli]MBB3044505.1 hypothetical protein [Nocardioides soli]
MWNRARGRLSKAGGIVLALGWLGVAVAIATGPLDLEPRHSNLWVVVLIFLAPFAVLVLVLVTELVHGIKNGPQAPSPHARSPVT